MKYVYLFFFFFMVLAIVAQLNDPDPWAWVALYGSVAIVCVAAAFKAYHPAVPLIALMVIIIWAGTLWPSFTNWIEQGTPSIGDEMKESHPYIEEVREFLGLVLCALILIFTFFQKRRQAKK